MGAKISAWPKLGTGLASCDTASNAKLGLGLVFKSPGDGSDSGQAWHFLHGQFKHIWKHL